MEGLKARKESVKIELEMKNVTAKENLFPLKKSFYCPKERFNFLRRGRFLRE